MLVARKFIFVHIPKTGGTWMRNAITWSKISVTTPFLEPIYTAHVPLGYLSEKDVEGKQAYTLIRNPWDWYVSEFFFTRAEMTKRLSHPGTDRWPTLMLYRNFKNRVTSGLSLSEITHNMTEHPTTTCNFLRLEDGLLKAFQTITEKGPPSKLGPINATKRPPYQEMYDDQLKQVVLDRDGGLIERFGYSFE